MPVKKTKSDCRTARKVKVTTRPKVKVAVRKPAKKVKVTTRPKTKVTVRKYK